MAHQSANDVAIQGVPELQSFIIRCTQDDVAIKVFQRGRLKGNAVNFARVSLESTLDLMGPGAP
jgi:hypothetical protein